MNPEEWERVKALFERALEVEPGERRDFLHRACGENASLLAEVESLLATYEPDSSVSVDSPGNSGSGGTQDTVPRRIGQYQLVRRIGTGGMGAVYLAFRADDVYEKSVAIKLVEARIDTREIVSRFRHERQILAALDHPNIARLLDGGTTDAGLPYFVMDYVEGTRIDEYCDSRSLSILERVALFLNVCAAVQCVHQNLVIHRDLKPGNILVTSEGIPKLLDFGIAKLLKPESFNHSVDATRVGFRIMTPRYASPEQVRGEPVTTASDVYSLGVILYELLTAHRPYDLKTESPVEVVRAVCEHEPEKPSTVVVRPVERDAGEPGAEQVAAEQIAATRGTVPARLRRQLRGDLDTIVLKALRKEPQRRYGSVEQLAEDLRRHIQGLPVRAHADTWKYRTRKFVGRHRAGVAAAMLILISLVGGVATTAWQAGIARTERARAERQFNDVRTLSTSFLFEFHNAIQKLPGSTPARQLVVQRALQYLSKLAEEARDDRRLQRELAEAYLKVGDVQGNPYASNLGDTSGAAQSYTEALRISRVLSGADPRDADAKRYLARSYESLGEVLPQLGRPNEAVTDLEHAAEILESLVADAPADTGLRDQLARCYQVLGDLQGHSGLENLGDPVAALESYRKALALYEGLLAQDSHNRSARRGVELVQIRIGDLQEARDALNEALRSYRRALEIAEALSDEDPTNTEDRRRLALAHRKVGGIQEELGNNKEALDEYAKAASINKIMMEADPSNVQASMSFVISLRWTGDLLNTTGDTAAALSMYRTVVAILERLYTADPDNLTVGHRYSEILIVTGRLLAQGGTLGEARRLTSRGLAIARELASRPEATPDDLSQYAIEFLTCEPSDLREPATALRFAEASVAKSSGADSDNLDVLAQAYFENGQVARAIETEEHALRLLAVPTPNLPSPPRRQRLEAQLARFKSVQASTRHTPR